jgi:hypothetical protein
VPDASRRVSVVPLLDRRRPEVVAAPRIAARSVGSGE